MRRLFQAIALLSTSWVLVATSRVSPPCSGNLAEKVTFRVEGDCGPPGIVTIDSDSSCGLDVSDSRDVQLPTSGSQMTAGRLMTTVIELGGQVTQPDGGRLPLRDGGARDEDCNGCLGIRRDCRGVADGGVFELSCIDQDGERCTAVLTP